MPSPKSLPSRPLPHCQSVPDYYKIIKQPMCFKQILQKLRRRTYPNPEAFYSVRCSWRDAPPAEQRRVQEGQRMAHAACLCAAAMLPTLPHPATPPPARARTWT